VGSLLASASGVDVVAHVGSAENGRQISVWAAGTGAHVIREGRGNDVLLIDGDVDPEWAAELAAHSAFGDRGFPSSTERILVHADIAEPFVTALAKRARDLNLRDVGPVMIDSRSRITLQSTVTAAVAAGAVVLVGGRIPLGDGWHYPATVVANCPVDSKLMTQETKGPVASVATVLDFETGLIMAAFDADACGATVLSGSTAHIFDAVETLQVQTLGVNVMVGRSSDGRAAGSGAPRDLLAEMSLRKRVQLGVPVLADDISVRY
jgi:betaine-aldehyde dehydrogenase